MWTNKLSAGAVRTGTWTSIGIVLLITIIGSMIAGAADQDGDSDRWEPSIKAFEKSDRASPPEPGGVMFLGSSSIRMWDLGRWFPGIHAANRGFGGSRISDSVRFFDRIVVPRAPGVIVFYAGDNDVAGGMSADGVFRDYLAFVARVRTSLPETHVVFIAVKPSRSRWRQWLEMRRVNDRILGYSASDPRLHFADIAKPMLSGTKDGDPPPADLFLQDGLHLNDKGYRMWVEVIAPLIKAAVGGRR